MDTTTPQPASTDLAGPGPITDPSFLARYDVGDEVGRGGMGAVYRGRHRRLDMPVAIKVMLPQAGDERFTREARLLAAVRSPHVVAVHDCDTLADGRPVLVMDWVDGTDLQRLIREQAGPLPEDRVLPWMRQACDGMQAVHDQGIVHRDLKPSNVLVDGHGAARVADFGLARGPTAFGELSLSGALMGTPHYMAPEQAEDPRRVDGRADVYSFGATFYHALTGRRPFDGETAFAVLYKHKAEPLTAPRAVNPGLSDRTAEVIERCLAKDPTDRFPSFAAVRRHLGPDLASGSPWAATDDRELAPFLTRYRASRDRYLTAADGWNVDLDAYTFPRGQTLRIVRGDIVAQRVDAMVSSDNHFLQLAVGVSGAIGDAAGPGVVEQARRLAPVRPGRAVSTAAGDLPARLVFHAVTVGYVDGRPVSPSRDLIAELMASCFYLADTHGVRSIAFPLLGTGAMGFPAAVCLDVMFQSLARAFLHALTTVREARIVLYGAWTNTY